MVLFFRGMFGIIDLSVVFGDLRRIFEKDAPQVKIGRD